MAEEPSVSGERDRHVNQIISDYLEAVDAGKTPDREEWLRRYPEFAADLKAFFADYEDVDRAAAPLRAAPAPALPALSPSVLARVPPTTGGNQPAGPSVGATVRYFGDYELLAEIARGGMGVVYKARQISLNRTVAVKMILAGRLATKADQDRFRSEAQAAGLLDHPNIVPIFEVGEHEGQHYFSMGYVDGPSLASRLVEGPLPPKDAAKLVATVAGAVQYAHRQGVIHRDIKPSNILIDSNGVPRVTDFGLAKRVDSGSDLTASGQILGTPSYMPPEQAAGQINAIGPAADVYALGALLYAALTGRPPFQAATSLETMQQVLTRDPPAVRQLNPDVPHDLETIALKCLDKSITRRYATAHALAEDLTRFLEGRPILARPARRWEHAWRWCLRNPVVAALSGAAGVLLITVAVVASTGYFVSTRALGRAEAGEKLAEDRLVQVEAEKKRVEDEKAKTEEEKQVAQAVRGFLQNKLLGQADTEFQANLLLEAGEPTTEVSPNPTVRELLDRAARELAPDKIEATFPNQPLLQAELLFTVGKTYNGIGVYGPAEALLTRAVQLRKTGLGPEHADTLAAMVHLANTYQLAYKLPEAIELYSQVRDARVKTLGPEHPDTLATLNQLAEAYFKAGRIAQATELCEHVRDLKIKVLGTDNRSTLATLVSLAALYVESGKLPQAIELSQQVHAAAVRLFGPEHPYTLSALLTVGDEYLRGGRREEALALLQQVRDTAVKKLGPENPITLRAISALGCAYAATATLKAENLPIAIQLLEQARDGQTKVLGADHPNTLSTLDQLGVVYLTFGKPAAAVELLQHVCDAKVKKLGPNHCQSLLSAFILAKAYRMSGNLQRAQEMLDRLLPRQQDTLGPDSPYTLQTLEELGTIKLMSGRFEEAITVFERLRSARVRMLGDEHPMTLVTLENLAAAYYGAGKLSSAIEIYEHVRDVQNRTIPPNQHAILRTLYSLAQSYQADGRLSRALPLFEQAAAGVEKLDYVHENAAVIVSSAIAAYETAGQFDKAEPWRRKWSGVVEKNAGRESPAYAGDLALLGLNLLHQKKFSASEAVLRECLQLREKLLAQKQAVPWQIACVRSMLGEALLGQGKTVEAGPLLVAGYDGLKRDEKTIPEVARSARMREAIERLIDLATAKHKPDDVKKWQAELAEYPAEKPAARK
jgi:eukaryotic-like serine/threonine-protein kinase